MQRQYKCDDHQPPISLAVHLGRLAAGYALCRRCKFRNDRGALPSAESEEQATALRRDRATQLFGSEGAEGVLHNDIDTAVVRRLARAMGVWAYRKATQTIPETIGGHRASKPVEVFIGCDGRPATSSLVATASDGLRHSGVSVCNVGATTTAGLIRAMGENADGGFYLGGPLQSPERLHVRFFGPFAIPLSVGGNLREIESIYDQAAPRSTRQVGDLRRVDANLLPVAQELAFQVPLRPLRVLVETHCRPALDELQRIVDSPTVRLFQTDLPGGEVASRLIEHGAHLAIRLDDDGETCQVWDGRAQPVPTWRLFSLLVERLFVQGGKGDGNALPFFSPTVLVDRYLEAKVAEPIIRRGCQVLQSTGHRAAMATAMRESQAQLAADRDGRFWRMVDGWPVPDAVWAAARFMEVFSGARS